MPRPPNINDRFSTLGTERIASLAKDLDDFAYKLKRTRRARETDEQKSEKRANMVATCIYLAHWRRATKRSRFVYPKKVQKLLKLVDPSQL